MFGAPNKASVPSLQDCSSGGRGQWWMTEGVCPEGVDTPAGKEGCEGMGMDRKSCTLIEHVVQVK